ncbi:MAG: hypothetical protein J5769_01240 [Bacteroidales bacterium]|nr:hypothetical protein [Bacteroidales bacterium]
MKKTILAILLFAASALIMGAQDIRTNYRSGSKTHISTDYEELTGGECPIWIRVEKVGYSDGSSIYLLYLNFEQKTSTNVPKGVKIAFNLPSGAMVRADQIGQESSTKRSIMRGNNKVYWNRTKYALEEADMKKISRGISSIDVVTGWNPEDYIQMNFKADELAALFRRHMDAIDKASASTINLKAELGARANNRNNILTTAKPITARGANYAYNVKLTHLYYKNTNKEDFDLNIQIGSQGKHHIAIDSQITFTLANGSTLVLKQAIDEDDIFTVYPSIRELRLLCGGIKAISVAYEGGTLTDTFSGGALSSAINQQYQLLMSVSDR